MVIEWDIYMTSMKISEDTKRALLNVAAEHTIKDGKVCSLGDTAKILTEEHRLNRNSVLLE